MAISKIQQSQISGSLSYLDNLTIGSGLAGKTKLSDDLNALRSLIKDIKGEGSWYDAAGQDLKQIYDAMHADGATASFQGNVEVLTGSITASGNVHAGLGYGQGDGGVTMYDGGNLSMDGALQVDGNAEVDGTFGVDGAAQLRSTLAVSDVATFSAAMTGSAGLKLAGDLDVNSSADIQGAVNLQSTLAVGGLASFAAGVAVSGAALDVNADLTANKISIDGDTVGRLYVVGASGEIADSSALSYENSHLSVTGSAGVTGALSAASAVFAGTLSAGASSLSSAAISGNATVGGTLGVTGAATFSSTVAAASVSTTGNVSVGGNLSVAGTSAHVGASTFSAISNQFNALAVTGSAGLSVISNASVGGTLSSTGNFSVNTNKFTVAASSGNTVVAGTLSVAGAASLAGGLVASNIVSSGTGSFASGVSVTSGGVTIGAGGLTVQNGSTSVQGLSAAGSVSFSDTLGVAGFATLSSGMSVAGTATMNGALVANNSATFNGSLSAKGSSSMETLSVSGSAGLQVAGPATFSGLVDVNAGLSASLIKIDGDVAQRLYIVDSDGSLKDEIKLTFDGSDLSITGGLRVSGNAVVDGDLQVKGAFTYIETENMKVKDAFIYLATGSAGASDSGIVLSKGAGGAWDLIVGQDGGAGELIFAKQAHNSAGDSPADLNGAALVPAWMSSVKVGSAEGDLSGSLAVASGGISLSSEASKSLTVSGGGDLLLAANGNAAISFASAAQVPDASFAATTVVGMLNELRIDLDAANSGGNLSKASYGAADFAGNVLSFAGQGTLSAASHKLVDVFLNGVLMAPSRDLTAITTTSVTFDASIVSSLIADDVIVVVVRG